MNAWGRLVAAGTVAVGLGLIPAWRSSPAGAANCRTTISVDPSFGQAYPVASMGSSVGETFLAADTLIKSLSVWRGQPAGYSGPGPGVKLWIVGTDPSGVPDPVRRVLLNGPLVYAYGDSGPSRPLRVQFVFDPPFRLPGPGLYGLFVQDPCLTPFDVLADTSRDVYPDGRLWQTGRTAGIGCYENFANTYPNWARWDLIFEIEFCKDALTPTRRRSWGQLKVIYR